MMDLNDENHSSHNAGDVQNLGERLKQETASNNAPVKISGQTDSKTIVEDNKYFASHGQENSHFEKETESCEVVVNVWHSFNTIQRANVNIHEKDKLPNYTFEIERSLTSRTFGSLLPDTSEHKIQSIAQRNDKDVKNARIISTSALPISESSTSESTIIPKRENWPSFSNAGFHKREKHCDIFKEDDDWDIYQPGIVTKEPLLTTKSPLESQFSFERSMIKNKHFSKNNSKSDVDYDSYQRASPYTARGTRYSASNDSVNNDNIFPDLNEERMLEEVKEYFLNNPGQVTDDMNELESKQQIITTPYFSMDFALRHGLPLPTISPIQEPNELENASIESRILAAYEMMSDFRILEEDFFRYIHLDYHRTADTGFQKGHTYSGLEPSTILHLDLIQEEVGPDAFLLINDQLRTRYKEFRTIFRDPELLDEKIQFWNRYEKGIELLREQNKISEDSLLSQIRADSTSDIISEDILVSQTNAEFPSTTSRSHVIKTPGLNDSDSYSYAADDDKVKELNKIWKTSQSSTGLSTVHSIKPDISETELKKCSPILKSTNEDNKYIRTAFDSLQGHSDKSNDLADPASKILSHIQNSEDRNNEENSSEVQSVKSRNSPNNATHCSDQTFKENSDDQSRKSYEVLEIVSNVQFGVRKHTCEDNAKSRKKIRLQENSNTEPETKKESPMKDESKTPSQGNWPGKPGSKCIVM